MSSRIPGSSERIFKISPLFIDFTFAAVLIIGIGQSKPKVSRTAATGISLFIFYNSLLLKVEIMKFSLIFILLFVLTTGLNADEKSKEKKEEEEQTQTMPTISYEVLLEGTFSG